MSASPAPIPRAPLIYGLLGLIPFLTPPALAAARPDLASACALLQAIYAALILSFLGGARWGFAVAAPRPRPWLVSLSMVPTLAALALLFIPSPWRTWQLLGFAGALTLQGIWDIRARDLPAWYPRLRLALSLAAVAGLSLGAWTARG